MKRKIIVLTIMNVIMMWFVIFMFKKSEPNYVNNSNRRPMVWDYVIVTGLDTYGEAHADGVVVQTDSTSFVFRYQKGIKMDGPTGGLWNIPYNAGNYKVIGTGTFYHKVNAYVGFNIMLITTLIIIVFFAVVFYTETSIIWSLVNKL
jgi:hypothetical protein